MNAYVSGVAYFGTDNTDKKRNPKAITDLKNITPFNFDEMSKRERDVVMLEAMGHTLSLKIKIQKNPVATSKQYVIINDVMYSISYIDKYGNDMFIYLEAISK